MHARLLLPFAVAAVTAAPPPVQATAPAPHTAEECEVWDREMSFARSVAEHDAVAFAAHLAPDAVFAADSPRPTRGREAVAKAWSGIVRGDGLRLEWYPARTTVSGDLAWSTGPALVERLDGGEPRFASTTFQSVWRRDPDGRWRVVFDTGTRPQPVDEAAATAFRRARPAACPGA